MSERDGFKFEGRGRVERVDHFQSKAGKDIVTIVFAIDDDKYPQVVPVKVFGRLAGDAADWKPGTVLAVKGRLGGRDWNGKCYPDIVADSIEVISQPEDKGAGAVPSGEVKDPGSLPF